MWQGLGFSANDRWSFIEVPQEEEEPGSAAVSHASATDESERKTSGAQAHLLVDRYRTELVTF